MFPKKRVAIILLVLCYAEGQAKSFKHVKAEQKVVVALGSVPRSLDPRQATDANSMRLTDLLFDPLVRLGPNLQVEPALANKWTYKDKLYTFFISPHWSFSHGRKISQEDLLFSFEEYKKGPFASALEVVESVQVRKEKNFLEYHKKGERGSPIKERKEEKGFLVLEIKLKKESSKFLRADLPIFKILPHDLARLPDFHKKPIGTGPFKLKSQTPNQLVLHKWYQEEPQTGRGRMMSTTIKEVMFKIIRDDGTRFQKMLNEELDIVQSDMPFQKIARFVNKKDRFQVFQGPGLSTTYLLMNLKDPCLKNKEMRQWLSYSIDRQKIIQYKLKGLAHPAITILSPSDPFFNPHLIPLVHNLKKAKALWNKLSKKCQQHVFSFKSSHARSAMDHGKALTIQLKRAGMHIKRESYEWGRFYSDLNEGNFQLALLKWVGVMDPDIYRVAFHSKELAPKGRNRGFYQNNQVDQLLEQGASTMAPDKRKALYHQVQKIIQKDLPFIPLWHEEQTAILRKNILNYHLSRAGDFRYLMNITKKKTSIRELKGKKKGNVGKNRF